MARPRIGLFGALMVIGGIVAWKMNQRQRAQQAFASRELNRWEGEGGNVEPVTSVGERDIAPRGANGGNGAAHHNGKSDPWPFPHS